ncbi:DeoR/GlpR family DNA-binding transcription regulator [Aliifodinibius salicampi]|uniref:DeoR/GlpR family DNA-binding transcription regulator n=1 Tax=Fodinibius salicampi TaxID=1920655 RepID=A0ABT3PZS2_9BACT|nr:transcriptional repressor AgaR [Fodinibius salicampi]MCW9713369.1 DeoR/GlpR family DNA-binding transcription regulator [Fodinibius salicampi]
MKSTVDRRDKIIQKIQSEGSVRVDELSEEFDVSTVTIRNDLDFFEEKGLIHRTYGGALLRNNVYNDPSLEEKQKINVEEKKRIGEYAAGLVSDGDSIILDSGTTTREIALRLKEKKDLTLMTNAINIAVELAGVSGMRLMLTGGVLRDKSYSLVGPEAERMMENYYFDKLFLGVDGMNFDHGLTTPNPQEAQLNRMMVERSNTVILVSDSSKFGRHSFSYICGLEPIETVITDTKISSEFEEGFKERDIEVVKV